MVVRRALRRVRPMSISAARHGPLILLFISTAACEAAPAMPPPGHYRIDGEAVMRSGNGLRAT